MNFDNLITQIVISLIGVLAFALIYITILLAPKLKLWIDAKAATGKNEIVWYWAQQGYAYAEKKSAELGTLSGSDKAMIAYDWVSDRLATIGIKVTADQIKGAIQLAWHKLEQVPKQQGSTAVVNTEIQATNEHLEQAAEKAISKVLDS